MRAHARNATGAPSTVAPHLVHRLGRLAVVLVVLLLGSALPASAHSNIERSDPANGGMVPTGRTELTLWFGEAITESGSSFAVRSIDPTVPPVPTTPTLDDGDTVVHLATPPLTAGTYTIAWAVVGDDGHPTQGTITFGAGFRPDGIPNAESTSPPPLSVGVRLADLCGTLLALGALAVLGRVLAAYAGGGVSLRRRVLTAGAGGAALSLVAATATPLLIVRGQVGADAGFLPAVRDVLLGSTWGLLWLARLLALAVAVVTLWRARRVSAGPRPDGGRTGASRTVQVRAAGAALVLAAVLDASSGHASTLPARSALAVVAAALHVLAAGVWAGGLMVLVLTVVPLMRMEATTRRTVGLEAWRAFAPRAAVAAGVLVATGLYEAGRHLTTPSDLSGGPYGLAVLAKVLLVAVALAVAGYNTLIVNPHVADRVGRRLGRGPGWGPPRHRLLTTVTVEAVILLVAVAGAAVMTSVPTAREADAASAVTAPFTDTVDGLFVTFEAVPIGSRTRLVVRSEAVEKPLPNPVTGVEAAIADGASTVAGAGDRVQMTATEPGRYEALVTSVPTGRWTAEIAIHRAGAPDSVLSAPWSTAASNAATTLELAGSGAAALLLLVTGSGLVLVLRRRRGAGAAGGPSAAAAAHSPSTSPEAVADAKPDSVPALEEVGGP